MHKLLIGAIASIVLFSNTLWGQTVTGASADWQEGNTGTIVFQSTDDEATITSKPSWIEFIHEEDQSSVDIGGGVYEITLEFEFTANWQPDAITTERSGNLSLTGGGVVPVTQSGIDNTYVYAIFDPSNGEDGTLYREVSGANPVSLVDFHSGFQSEIFAVFARVDRSPVAVTPIGEGWEATGTSFDSITLRGAKWISASVSEGLLSGGDSFKGRNYSFGFTLNYGDNVVLDGVTESRNVSVRVGATANGGVTIDLSQPGIDNTNVYEIDGVVVPNGGVIEIETEPVGFAQKTITLWSKVPIGDHQSSVEGPAWGSGWDVYSPVAIDPWISISAPSGVSGSFQGREFGSSFTLRYGANVIANQPTDDRRATFKLGTPRIFPWLPEVAPLKGNFSILQPGVDVVYDVTFSPEEVPFSGGTVTAVVLARPPKSSFTYSAGSFPWITANGSGTGAVTESGGVYSGTASFTIASQASQYSAEWYPPREGSVTVDGKSYHFTQRGGGLRWERVSNAPGGLRGMVELQYDLGHQRPSNEVVIEYSLGGAASFVEIDPDDVLSSEGQIGENVEPGVHTVHWDASSLTEVIEKKIPVFFRVSDLDGFSVVTGPLVLEGCAPGSPEPASRPTLEGASCMTSCDGAAKTFGEVGGSFYFRYSLGSDLRGRSYGSFWLHEDAPSSGLFTPDLLRRSVSPNAQTFPAGESNFTQVLTSGILYEVVDENSTDKIWKIVAYDANSDLGEFDEGSGVYDQSGMDPLHTVTFSSTLGEGGAFEELVVQESGVHGARRHVFEWAPEANGDPRWLLEMVDPAFGTVRREEVVESISVDGLTTVVDRKIKEASGKLVARVKVTKHRFPFGENIVEREEFKVLPNGNESGSQKTFFEYQENIANDGYGQLVESYTDFDSNWSEFIYGQDGVATIKRPYTNAGRGGATGSIDVTSVEWESDNFGLGVETDYAKTIVRSHAGDVVSRVFEINFGDVLSGTLSDGVTPFSYREKWILTTTSPTVTTVQAALSSSSTLKEEFRFYVGGGVDNLLRSSRRPDGTAVIHEYGADSETVWSGAANSGTTAVSSGIRQSLLFNDFGELIADVRIDIESGLLLKQDIASTVDELGRPTLTTFIDGSEAISEYSCCGLTYEKDRAGTATSYTRDMLGRLRSVTRAGVTTNYGHDALGRVTSVSEEAGGNTIARASIESDSLGLLIAMEDAVGRDTVVATSYDGSSGAKTVTVSKNDGGTIVEQFGLNGALVSRGGSAAYPILLRYGYDSTNGRYVETVRLGVGNSESDASRTYYDFSGRPTLIASSHESGVPAVTDYDYDGVGRLSRITDPDGVSTLYEYHSRGEVSAIGIDLNANGTLDRGGVDRITEIETDVTTRSGENVVRTVEKIFRISGSATATTWRTTEASVDGLSVWTTEAGLSSSAQATLEGSGVRETHLTRPDGTKVFASYTHGFPTLVRELNTSGAIVTETSYDYDPFLRLEHETDLRNGTTTYTYYDDDLIESKTTPSPGNGDAAQTTTYGYDAGARLASVTLPDGASIARSYYDTGDLHVESGARIYASTYTYDPQGRVKSLVTAGGTTTWDYYPESGRLKQKFHVDLKGPEFTYTQAGRLFTRENGRGILATYGYDDAGSLSSIGYNDSTPAIVYERDRLGQLESATRAGVVRSLTHTLLGQLDTETFAGGVLNGVTLDPQYDAFGRPQGTSASGTGWSHVTSYLYDAAGRIEHVDFGAQRSTYGYQTNSQLIETVTQSTTGEGVLHTVQRGWDHLNRLDTITSTASIGGVVAFDYGLNLANQRTSLAREDGRTWDFDYDSLGQLESSVEKLPNATPRTGRTFGYNFDSIGNRETASVGASGSVSYTAGLSDPHQYAGFTHPGTVVVTGEADASATVSVNLRPAAPRQGTYFADEITLNNSASPVAEEIEVAATLGGVTEKRSGEASVPKASSLFEYDDDGNLVFDGANEYTWDAENRLVEINTRIGSETVGAIFPSFRQQMDYDDLGRRIRSRLYHEVDSVELLARDDVFVYDGWKLIAVISGQTGDVLQRFAWGLDLSQTVGGAGNVSGLLIFEDTAVGQSHFPRYDGNGNVIGLVAATDPVGAPVGTPASGEVSAVYEYDPFGNALAATGYAAERNPFRFSTTYKDPVTDFSYYGYRFYDPSHGRWLSRDPIAEAGGLNLYGFVGNDPMNAVDRWGLDPQDSVLGRFFAKIFGNFNRAQEQYFNSTGDAAEGLIEVGQVGIAFNEAVDVGKETARVPIQIAGAVTEAIRPDPAGDAMLLYGAYRLSKYLNTSRSLRNTFSTRHSCKADENYDLIEMSSNHRLSDTPRNGSVFRGTTRGYSGGGSGVTFTSTDPAVATVFAVQKRGLGTPVLEIARTADLAHVPRLPSTSPSLAKIEAEIIFDISPTEFSKLATQVPLDEAVRALNEMGVRVPSNAPLSDVSSVLRELQKLNQSQIDDFLRAVAR